MTSFYLRPADGGPLATYKPGQYVTIKIDHPTTPTSPRNYSLSDQPGTGYYRISVKREPALVPQGPAGLISNYLHDQIQEGDQILVGPPCGEFTLDESTETERPVVFLAGGIGVTPLLSMFKSLVSRSVRKPVYFLQAARNSEAHAFSEEVQQLAASQPEVCIHVRYDAPLAEDLTSGKCHSTGFVDADFLNEFLPGNEADFYICGPKPYMSQVYQLLSQRGVDPSQIRFEFFGPKAELTATA